MGELAITQADSPGESGIPPSAALRRELMERAEEHVGSLGLVPPLSLEELRRHARTIMTAAGVSDQYEDFSTVLCGNAVWRDTMATIPYERRVLLLPQCLRKDEVCQAEMDDFGLLCAECGACAIGRLQAEAERLGYVVLVAEGTTVVTKLLEGGKVDAVIGVSCLSALEKSFSHMLAGAVPGIAVPLLRNGCRSTEVDVDWVLSAIRLRQEGCVHHRVDLDVVRAAVNGWFDPTHLAAALGEPNGEAQAVALEWLGQNGKRWRPLLATCVYDALTGMTGAYPDLIRHLALAVECFHKASLVHDDIEDGDDERYGEPTVHQQYGVPVALNVGDLLLGQGYRLIARCGAPPEHVVRMLDIAAVGHETLCIGQGRELSWMRTPRPISSREVIEIFRGKTAPAFGVALALGAVAAGADGDVCDVMASFSEALGIAYQVRDDLDDFFSDDVGSDALACRPALPLALAYEQAADSHPGVFEWSGMPTVNQRHDMLALARELKVDDKARQLMEHYKNEAVRSLSPLKHAPLKGLLRRLVSRILGQGAVGPHIPAE